MVRQDKVTSSAGSSVPIGQKQGPQLEVSGTSTDNSITDCQVSVIVNNVKPYQQVRANGSGGVNDFSSWNFLLNSSYTTIKEGPNNKITSKIICHPNLTKWYSVNVTGVLSNASILNITSPSALFPASVGIIARIKNLILFSKLRSTLHLKVFLTFGLKEIVSSAYFLGSSFWLVRACPASPARCSMSLIIAEVSRSTTLTNLKPTNTSKKS